MLFTNEGWETGDFGDWVKSGSAAVPNVESTDPRTGVYNLRFTTASSSTQFGDVTFTITDAAVLAALSGRVVAFTVYYKNDHIFSGSGDDNNSQYIEVGDDGSNTQEAIPFAHVANYTELSVQHTIKANPTSIHFKIYWYKAGGADINRIRIDDMESDPEIAAELPTATTNPATLVAAATATPNGTLIVDGHEACDCGFEWGETDAYGYTTPTQSRTTGQTFAQTIIGLDPNKTYHFKAFATNAAGTSYGADRTFTTLVAAPTVTTDPVTERGMIIASFNGLLNDDGGEACECGFQWGHDITYGATTETESKVTGEAFSQRILGLFPGTEYHYRTLATNSAGTSYGADESFHSEPSFSRAYALAREGL